MSDREPFREARDAGLKARHETRVERHNPSCGCPSCLAALAVDKIAKTARAAIRRQVAEEIAAWADDLAAGVMNPDKPYNQGFIHASQTLARHAREIGAKETS